MNASSLELLEADVDPYPLSGDDVEPRRQLAKGAALTLEAVLESLDSAFLLDHDHGAVMRTPAEEWDVLRGNTQAELIDEQ